MAEKEATLLLKIKETGSAALEKTTDILKGVAAAALAAGTAAVAFATKAFQAYSEQERAVNKLNQAMVNNGIFTKELSSEYQKQASELQRLTTFGDEQILSAQASIQQYIGQQKVTKELTKATLDLATATGMDLDSAAKLVGKSIGSSTNALTRYGIEIDANSSKSQKLTQVIEGVNRQFGGQAEAAAMGTGRVKQLQNALSDIEELIGEALAPIIIESAKILTEWASKITIGSDTIRRFKEILITAASGAVILKNTILGVTDVIGNQLAGGILAITKLINLDFKGAWQEAKNAAINSTNDVVERYKQSQTEIATLNQIGNAQIETQTAEHNERMRTQSEANRATIDAKKEEERSFDFAKDEEKIIHKMMVEDQILRNELAASDQRISAAKTDAEKLAAIRDKSRSVEEAKSRAHYATLTSQEKALHLLKQFQQDEQVQNTKDTLGTISTLTQSNNKTLKALGKAAAIANIGVSTAEGVMKAWSLGPILGPILAPLVVAAGAVQIGRVAAMAEGGIVKATPGGMPAIIGEGGRDEAVIPLDSDEAQSRLGGGSTININVYGGMLGDESSAKQLAMAIDEQLFKLRRENQSLLFDGLF